MGTGAPICSSTRRPRVAQYIAAGKETPSLGTFLHTGSPGGPLPLTPTCRLARLLAAPATALGAATRGKIRPPPPSASPAPGPEADRIRANLAVSPTEAPWGHSHFRDWRTEIRQYWTRCRTKSR